MQRAPSGRQFVLVRGDQEVVAVEVGGGLRTYRAGGIEVLDGYGEHERASAGRGQVLAPWPNRVGDGRYVFEGRQMQLPLDETDKANAIHGLARWRTWDLLDAGTRYIVLGCTIPPQPGWEWTVDLRVSYSLSDVGLDVTLAARNAGADRCPFAAGFHPYLRAPTGRVDDLELTVPASTRYLSDDRLLPTGTAAVAGSPVDFRRRERIGARALNVAFTDLDRGSDGVAVVEARDPATGGSIGVHLGPRWTHVMVYTGDAAGARARQGLAIEPMTAPADALRSGEGLASLDPGETFEATWGIRPGWLGAGGPSGLA